jgi:hypothetical protein
VSISIRRFILFFISFVEEDHRIYLGIDRRVNQKDNVARGLPQPEQNFESATDCLPQDKQNIDIVAHALLEAR